MNICVILPFNLAEFFFSLLTNVLEKLFLLCFSCKSEPLFGSMKKKIMGERGVIKVLHALETLHIYWKKRGKTTLHTVCNASNSNDINLKQCHIGGYTVKKVSDFPIPSRDVTNQTLPGKE